jgi:hypothetical protein
MANDNESNGKFNDYDRDAAKVHHEAASHCVDMLADWFLRPGPKRDPSPARRSVARSRKFLAWLLRPRLLRWERRKPSVL